MFLCRNLWTGLVVVVVVVVVVDVVLSAVCLFPLASILYLSLFGSCLPVGWSKRQTDRLTDLLCYLHWPSTGIFNTFLTKVFFYSHRTRIQGTLPSPLVSPAYVMFNLFFFILPSMFSVLIFLGHLPRLRSQIQSRKTLSGIDCFHSMVLNSGLSRLLFSSTFPSHSSPTPPSLYIMDIPTTHLHWGLLDIETIATSLSVYVLWTSLKQINPSQEMTCVTE